MPAAMLTEVVVLERGTAATGAVATPGTVIPVEDLTQFDEDGGRLDICGVQYDYTDIDEDASTITLATGLTVAVAEFDPVLVVAGGEVSRTYTAVLDMGTGDNVSVEIPYEWRAQIAEGLYDPAIPVVVSPDLTTITDIPGRDPVINGANVDPTGLPDPVPVDAPTVSPGIKAYGLPSSIVLRADAVAATTEIEYHVSTAPFTPTAGDPATLMDTTRSLVFNATELPDGTLFAELPLTTVYYFHTIAVNTLGAAPPSTEAFAPLDPTAVSAVITAEVIAGFILAGLIQVGSNITIDPDNGIQIQLANGGLISLPADGSAALFRKVVVEADRLLVYDNFELRGGNNRIAGTLTLAAAVVAPTTGPTVGQGWDAPGVQGVTSTAASTAYNDLNDDGTHWVTVSLGGGVKGIDKSTGAESVLLAAPTGLTAVSITRQGTDWYVLFNTTATGVRVVQKYNSSWVLQNQFNAPTAGVTPATTAGSIACDGTTLYYGFVNTNTSNAIIRSSTLTGGSVATVFTASDAQGTAGPLWVGSADLGAQRFVVGNSTSTLVYTSAGARVTTQEWATANGGNLKGIYWDGTNFYNLLSKTVWKMSPVVTSTARSIRYSQYDNVGTTHETAWSPAIGYTQPARSWMKVSTPAPQDAGGVDDPKVLRHYIQNGGAGNYFRQADVTASPWTAWYGAPSVAGATAVSTPDFSGVSNPGSVTSASGATKIGGDDAWHLADTSDQVACSADSTTTSTSNVTITGMSKTITALGTSDVWMVDLDLDMVIGVANTVNIVELVVDGTAQSVQIVTNGPAGRWSAHKRFRLTGLSAGTHALTARTRNTAGSTSATVKVGNSVMTVQRIA